jgi:hypothetical protein
MIFDAKPRPSYRVRTEYVALSLGGGTTDDILTQERQLSRCLWPERVRSIRQGSVNAFVDCFESHLTRLPVDTTRPCPHGHHTMHFTGPLDRIDCSE